MIRTYDAAVKFLENYMPVQNKRFPAQVGFDRMKYLCELLGDPHLKYKTIHVGGTSGKGSTATLISSILSLRFKVGLHTSPHLIKVNERIKLNSADISDADLISVLNKIKSSIQIVEKSRFEKPTYFEITTALAFEYFAQKKVDYAVIEVGMGGRFDGTNVILPEIAVLTNVGLDHTEILGDTVEKIARDKVGIIKPGIEVVSGVKQPSVIKIIKSKIKKSRSKADQPLAENLSLLGGGFSYKIKKLNQKGNVFDYIGEKTIRNIHLSLLGQHQVENACLAIRTIELLKNITSKDKDIRNALKTITIPGRFEIIQRNPLVILDGAHNPDKITALIKAIRTIFPHKKIHTILAIKKDKNAKKMISKLLSISHEILFTQYVVKTDVGDTVSYSSSELLALARELSSDRIYKINDDPIAALEKIIQLAARNDLILITGSLYLVGEIRKKLAKYL